MRESNPGPFAECNDMMYWSPKAPQGSVLYGFILILFSYWVLGNWNGASQIALCGRTKSAPIYRVSLALLAEKEETGLIVRMTESQTLYWLWKNRCHSSRQDSCCLSCLGSCMVLSSASVKLETAEMKQQFSCQKIFQTPVVRTHLLHLVSCLPGEK